jgi:hypothetical protein
VNGLLDDSRLNGVHDVRTALRPLRNAELVPRSDIEKLIDRVRFNCQVWGGSGTVFVPVEGDKFSDAYQAELIRSDVDRLDGLLLGESYKAPQWVDRGFARPYAGLLIADTMDREHWKPFAVPRLSADDPWRPIYAATLGDWTVNPDPDLFPHWIYDHPPETFEMFFDVERPEVEGSLDDLLSRLVSSERNQARGLSMLELAGGIGVNTGYVKTARVIPWPDETKVAAGPNIVVVFGEDVVADTALLWNLRHTHGSNYGLPIGIPADQLDHGAMSKLKKPGVLAAFGLSGGGIFVTSASLGLGPLADLVDNDPGVTTTSHESLLSFGLAPSIPRDQLATFTDGVTRIVPESGSDSRLLHRGGLGADPQMQLSVRVDRDPIPLSRTLRGDGIWGGSFAAGRAQLSVPSGSLRDSGSVSVEWPTPWLRLRCVAQDRGLDVSVSQPGYAGLNLISALGGLDQVRWLAHPGLVRLLYRLAERSGMTWWKNRWTEAHKAIEGTASEAVFEDIAEEFGRDDPAIAPPGEGRQLKFQEFVKALGGKPKAAEHWILWAEARHLVVRGTDTRCTACEARFWLPMVAISNEVVCPGCARTLDHPFHPRQLEFTYRLGEVVRRALEVDCLDHLFASRYLSVLLEKQGLVGVHPGVEFRERGETSVVAEADVLLLFADGSLVPGEVKRTASGLTPEEVAKMNTIANRLDSPWSLFALGQPARDCSPQLREQFPNDSATNQFLLTTDQTYADYPMLAMGVNPFDPEPITQADDDKRSQHFVSYLKEGPPDRPWSSQENTFLKSPEL